MPLFQKIRHGDLPKAAEREIDEGMTDRPLKYEARKNLQPLEQALAAAGIASAKSDARCLLGLALGRDMPVLPHEDIAPLTEAGEARLAALMTRRLAGEPISRIRGWREFWSLRFSLSAATLDPRPDSETVIEAALGWAGTIVRDDHQIGRQIGCQIGREGEHDGRLSPPALRCLDLGTGSGCLLLALLSEMPNATGIGIDINPDALVTAVENATSLGLADRAEFICHSFADDLGPLGMFDVILSNPPYIPTRDIDDLAVDVKSFDPALALDGGGDGMACWQGLLPRLAAVLKPDGAAFVEIGQGQENMVAAEAAKVNLRLVDSHQDLAGITRCLQFSIKM